jgi:hypothetical protein
MLWIESVNRVKDCNYSSKTYCFFTNILTWRVKPPIPLSAIPLAPVMSSIGFTSSLGRARRKPLTEIAANPFRKSYLPSEMSIN